MTEKPFNKVKKIHFIGIGGVGMSGIAKIVLNMGYQVIGSDQKESENLNELRELGMKIFIGHRKENVTENTNVIITSSAISPINEEIIAGRNKKIPIIQRGEMLAEIMRLKTGLAVAGTHGKTTTTSLISSIFYEANLSPTTIIGGRWFKINSNAELGKSHYMICETDESDGSFLKISPVYSVVTNIDYDHMDYYKNEENLLLNFLEFINKTPFYGKTFLCFNDANLRKIKNKIMKPFASYGIKKNAEDEFDIFADKIKFKEFTSEFSLNYYGKKLGKVKLNMPGYHNILNALAAIGIALENEISLKAIKKSLKNFHGVDRRASRIGFWKNLALIDDYGHHPTEIEATLSTLKAINKKIICLFQPHRYSRTLEHYKNFARSLLNADIIIITKIYSAGENPIKDVSAKIILHEMKNLDPQKEIYYAEDFREIRSLLDKIKKPKRGILISLGAGDINSFLKSLL